ncbi:MAG: NAD-dependent epimerase/dehydratase family protein [bacterium]|nr:NAD-dependent epimerase/dehydratase family protein [bacterium]
MLVTGVNGFIGSHVARRLQRLGCEVKGIVRPTSDLSFITGLDLQLFKGDVTDSATLTKPMPGVDTVVHVAGLASDWGPYRRFYEVNVTGTRNVAEAAARSGVSRFVHIGTTAVHGFPGFRDLPESAPMAETPFHYCETKKIAERWLFDFSASTSMEVTSIRPGNVFGPRDHTFMEKYLDAMVTGKAGYIDGGRRLTAPVYVANLVDGILAACTNPFAAGEAFTVTDGLDITWREFTESFASELDLRPPRLSIPFPLAYAAGAAWEGVYRLLGISTPPLLTRYRASNGGRDYHFSIEKARRLLGYSPAVGFHEAVARTVAWYRERGSEGAWE